MRRMILIGLIAVLAACGPADNDPDGGTPDPAAGESTAPLLDDAVGPSEQQEEIDESE